MDLVRLKERNSALLRQEIARGATRLESLPEVVNLNHTNICNLKCPFCVTTHEKYHSRLSRDVIERVADALFPSARKAVLTMAGEPLAADFDLIADAARRFAVKLDMVTNAVLLTPRRYGEIRGVLDHLNVSLDSNVPEIYERLRSGASFEKVHAHLRGIQELRERDPDDVLLTLSAVVQRSNLEGLPDFVRFAGGLGVDGVLLQHLLETRLTGEQDPDSNPGREVVNSHLREASRAAREAGVNLVFVGFPLPNVIVDPPRPRVAEPIASDGICGYLVQNFNVLFTGEVYPCCVPTDHVLGNVREQDPVEIWNGPAFVRLREAHRSKRGTPFCSGCGMAPHLKPRRPAWINERVKTARRWWRHVRGLRERARSAGANP